MLIPTLRAAHISLTSASSFVVIKSCKWQLLAWSRIHRGGIARWPLPVPAAVAASHWKYPWLALWIMADKMMDQFFYIGLLIHSHPPPFAPTGRVDIGICHSSDCVLGSHNCWLVKWVLARGIINIRVFTLRMIKWHRGEPSDGDWTAGAWHPGRREAAVWSMLMLSQVNLSVLVSGCALRSREGLVSDIGPIL